jgi:C4-dicarboxylate-specific signal transduction histidine kinase
VPPALLARLFQPYASGRASGEGMGLGLAISRKLLLDQGGDLELVGTSPAGTVFRLLLPEAEATA